MDFARPDLERFPRFAHALDRAQVADLETGDAIFIPSLWWHHVEALETFNVLINYWWRQSPDHMVSPMATPALALLTLRELPPAQRHAWAAMFQHFVFAADAETAAHVPLHARGALAPFDVDSARQLREHLRKQLDS